MSLRQSGAQKVTNFVNAINGLISSHNSSSTAHSTEMAKKVNVNQGTTNNGKFLKVSSGNVTCESVTIPSASSSTPSADVSGGAIGSNSNYAKADHQHPLSGAYATSGHDHDGTYLKSYTPPTGSTSQAGIVQLEDSVSSSSTAKAATPNSVKTAYNLANGKVSTNQGTSNSGKFLKVNSSGNVACESVTIPSAYTHPSTHPASMIIDNNSYSFLESSNQDDINNEIDTALYNMGEMLDLLDSSATKVTITYTNGDSEDVGLIILPGNIF